MIHRAARRLAENIAAQDWHDAHSRADGARHDRSIDYNSRNSETVSDRDAETIRANAAWVTAQALHEDDPIAFDQAAVEEFFDAAHVTRSITRTSRGQVSGAIWAGIRHHECPPECPTAKARAAS